MKLLRTALLVLMATTAIAVAALAADAPAAKPEQPTGMPPMGPPEELKQVAYLVGTWDCAMKMKAEMTSDKMSDSKGSATYAYILEGAAITMAFDGEAMPGMKFKGYGIQTWDRENKCWQMTWTDNMSARTSLYTGQHTGDQTVFQGEDQMMGMKYLSRISSFNEKPTSFDWKMEMSMDGGKTWMVMGTATYTKRK